MSDVTAKYGVELEDQFSGAARSAADAAVSLRDKIKEDSKEMREMRRAMRNMKGAGSASVETIRELQERIDAKKVSIAAATEEYVKMGGTFGDVQKGAGATGDAMKRAAQEAKGAADAARGAQGGNQGLLDSMTKAPGPLGRYAGSMQRAATAVKGLTAAKLVLIGLVAAVVAAFVAVTAAAAAAAVAVGAYAFSAASARREERLQLEALVQVRDMYGFAAASAGDLQDAIDQVSGSVALGRDKVREYAEQLHRMGIRGQQHKEALEVMSLTGAAAGDRIARRFAGMAASAAHAGESIDGVADSFRDRFGPIAEQKMLSLGTQLQKTRENLRQLFSGVQIDGFLRALHSVTSLFSQNEATGRALKAVIETVAETFLGPLHRGIEGSANNFRDLVRIMALGALKISNKWLEVEVFFLEHFGPRSKIRKMLGEFDLMEFGKNLIGGFVEGIKSKTADAINAVLRIAMLSRKAVRQALGIQSPSKVFADMGEHVSEGMAKGIDSGAPRVRSSMEDMADPPALPGGGGGGGALGGNTFHVNVGDINVTAPGGDPQEVAETLREKLAEILEGVLTEMGGAPA